MFTGYTIVRGPCVYAIRNIVNGKMYVGSSRDGRNRLCSHRSDLDNGNHKNIHLQSAYRKYGADKFVFEFMQVFPADVGETELRQTEKWHIHARRATDRRYGYNICGDPVNHSASLETGPRISLSKRGTVQSLETRRKIAEKRKATAAARVEKIPVVALRGGSNGHAKGVVMLSTDGRELARFPSMIEAELETGVPFQSISNCAVGKAKTAYGYCWKFDKPATQVVQSDLDDNVIGVYRNIYQAAAATGVGRRGIASSISGKRYSAGGYKWKRVDVQ